MSIGLLRLMLLYLLACNSSFLYNPTHTALAAVKRARRQRLLSRIMRSFFGLTIYYELSVERCGFLLLVFFLYLLVGDPCDQ
jgi:hypothetical protein